jgi:serine/threonine-protein kinase
VKVTDFGIARVMGDSTLTATGSVLGSAHYISPEQANGAPAGPATDIYSTGIVVYEMVTGSLPFTADSPVGVAMRHVTDDVPRPSAVNPHVPPALDAVVKTATARAPEERYPDAVAMAAALQAADRGETLDVALVAPLPPVSATTGGATDPGQTVWPIPGDRWNPQRIGRLVAVVFGILFAVAVALLVVRIASDEPRGRDGRGRSERRGANAGTARAASPTTTPAPAATLPDFRGDLFEDAEATLLADGFTVERNDQPHGEVEEGVVFDTSPPPHSAVTPGQTITLIVSTGHEEEEGDEEDEGPPGLDGGEPPGQTNKGKDKGKDED